MIVIDANVLAAADGLATHIGSCCAKACTDLLIDARDRGIVIDSGGAIIDEYRRCVATKAPPSVAREFLLELLRHEYNNTRVERVQLTQHQRRGYAEFPDDQDLASFDNDDRVYIATALASRHNPPIHEATDTEWWHARDALYRHGVRVVFLCPDLMS